MYTTIYKDDDYSSLCLSHTYTHITDVKEAMLTNKTKWGSERHCNTFAECGACIWFDLWRQAAKFDTLKCTYSGVGRPLEWRAEELRREMWHIR